MRTLIALCTLVCFTGCTTLMPIPGLQAANLREALEPGDTVELELVDGTRHKLEVESISEQALVGTDNKLRHTIPLESIKVASVRRMSTSDKWWTAAAVVGALAVVAAIAGGGSGGGSRDGGPGY